MQSRLVWNWRTQKATRARFDAELLPHLAALHRFAVALKAADSSAAAEACSTIRKERT